MLVCTNLDPDTAVAEVVDLAVHGAERVAVEPATGLAFRHRVGVRVDDEAGIAGSGEHFDQVLAAWSQRLLDDFD